MTCTEMLIGKFNLAHKLKKTENVLDGTDKSKKNLKNQETDGYGRDKRPEIEKKTIKKKVMITETRKKTETTKKP